MPFCIGDVILIILERSKCCASYIEIITIKIMDYLKKKIENMLIFKIRCWKIVYLNKNGPKI